MSTGENTHNQRAGPRTKKFITFSDMAFQLHRKYGPSSSYFGPVLKRYKNLEEEEDELKMRIVFRDVLDVFPKVNSTFSAQIES
jgi:hypothetical protein